jgi:dihydroorotase
LEHNAKYGPLARRQFLQAGVAAAFIGETGLFAADQKYDTVIRGGRVIDAAQKLNKITDIAISGGKIAAIKDNIPASAANQVLDATGKIVSPGLIDVHTHLIDPGMSPAIALSDGVTTLVDGGSVGSTNLDNLKKMIENPPNRVRVLLHVASKGNAGGEALDLGNLDPDGCRRVAEANPDLITGVKVRVGKAIAGSNDLEAIRLAVKAAGKLPIVIHVGDSVATMPSILALLRPGDVVTHMYAPTANGLFDANNKILPEVRAARKNGIQFDIGHGQLMHITWDVAQRALDQGFPPDTISTDLNQLTRKAQVFSLTNTISKFLLLGMKVEDVLACVTSSAARSLPLLRPYGSLKKGVAADITVLEMQEGNFEFIDNLKIARMGRQKLVATATFVDGKKLQG